MNSKLRESGPKCWEALPPTSSRSAPCKTICSEHPNRELDSVQHLQKRLVHLLRSCKCPVSHPPLYFRQLEMVVLPFLLVSCWLWCTVPLKRVNVVFNQVGSLPPLALQRQTYLLSSLLPLVLIHQMGVRMRPEESLRNLLYTQAASVQSEEHPKQPLHVSDKNTQLHDPKVIPSAIMNKKELKGKGSPEINKWKQDACGIPHVGLHIQQLQRSHSGLTRQILQNLQPRTTVLVKLCADVQQRLPWPPEFLSGNSFIQLLSGETLALLHQVKVLPGGCKVRHRVLYAVDHQG